MNNALQDYIVLDLETPNCRANSVCSIGIVIVKNNKIIDKKYSLINPEDSFDNQNINIHGINRSDVINSPTIAEYWSEIKKLFSNNIIVGHNIIFDLTVLAKALSKYDIKFPEVKYICTLNEIQKCLDLSSYKLPNICKHIGFEYDSHNALEDSLAANEVLNFILKNKKDLHAEQFDFHETRKKTYDHRLDSNINELYGIIQGINFDYVINNYEITLLEKWVKENNKYRNYELFYSLTNTISRIIEDKQVSKSEKNTLLNICSNIDNSKIYTKTTLNIQILRGILKGIIADNKLNEFEIINLKKWLDAHTYLDGIYPYDKILHSINKVLADRKITVSEKEELLSIVDEIMNPLKQQEETKIQFEGKTFCLTGDFKSGTKDTVKEKIEEFGGIIKTGISSKVNYLIVGSLGNENWKYGNLGGKIAKAKEYQEKGCNIEIISEDDFLNNLKQQSTLV